MSTSTGLEMTPDYPNKGIFYRLDDKSQVVQAVVIGNHLCIRIKGYGGVSLNREEAEAIYPALKEWLGK